jgi:hypothetical protein
VTGAWTGGFGYDNSLTFSGDFLLQPRFGFNYTFDTDRQMQLRGGVGLFQGDAPQVWVGNSYQSTGLNYVAYSNYRNCLYTGPAEPSRNATCLNTVFNPDGLNPTIPPAASANRNVNVIARTSSCRRCGRQPRRSRRDRLDGYRVLGGSLLTDVKDGLFYQTSTSARATSVRTAACCTGTRQPASLRQHRIRRTRDQPRASATTALRRRLPAREHQQGQEPAADLLAVAPFSARATGPGAWPTPTPTPPKWAR